MPLFLMVNGNLSQNESGKYPAAQMNCTPFVRQYDILSNKWGVYYAKRDSKQTIYARI